MVESHVWWIPYKWYYNLCAPSYIIDPTRLSLNVKLLGQPEVAIIWNHTLRKFVLANQKASRRLNCVVKRLIAVKSLEGFCCLWDIICACGLSIDWFAGTGAMDASSVRWQDILVKWVRDCFLWNCNIGY